MHFDTIESQLRTGDLLLFSGKSWTSEGIKQLTASFWSHVGLVWRITEGPHAGTLAVWESTTLADLVDLDTDTAHPGVQRVDLRARLGACLAAGYRVGVRQLSEPLDAPRLEALEALRVELVGRPYEEGQLELLCAVCEGAFGDNEANLDSLFCSELVAEAYQRMGLLDVTHASNEFTPRDFSSVRKLRLRDGLRLSNQVRITAV